MSKKMYVGNLPFSSTEDDLRDLFSQYGEVQSANIIYDRETGRSRGFGFVEMAEESADSAIEALNGNEFGGRTLRVNEARPRW
ncbi:MAG: RNA recognition motif domain-containing protein [Desulfovermiculus sp.]|jgi:RNA recognition motif-containing protein